MKKYTRKTSSPMVIVVPLIVAGLIIAGAILLSKFTTENRSRAGFASPLKQCTAACSSNSKVKNKGECVLDCPKVVTNTMTCDAFCKENVNPSGFFNRETEKTQNSLVVCKKQCSRWAADPCGVNGICFGLRQYTGACQTACSQVKSDVKMCAEAYTPQAFPGAPAGTVEMMIQKCTAAFE